MRDWRDAALCAQVDPELFFPEQNASVRPALALCQRCPVRQECLELALTIEGPPVVGVWGGSSEAERSRMRRPAASRDTDVTQDAESAGNRPPEREGVYPL